MTDVSTDREPGEDAAPPSPDEAGVPPKKPVHKLHRALGPAMATAVVVGNVIGSGIFLKPGTIAADAGNFPLIISVWVAGGVLCILGALCFAELATMLPQAGGLYVYLREAYGRPVAFLFGWTEFLIRVPGSIAALSVVFIGQLIWLIEQLLSSSSTSSGPTVVFVNATGEVLMVAVVIAALAGVNILGVVWGGWMQLVVTIIKAGVLALVALMPIIVLAVNGGGIDPANYATTITPQPIAGETAPPGLGVQIAAVLIAVMWAYNGWHGITPLAEEVRRPQRNIPLALIGGVGILIVLYLAANFAYHGVLTMAEVRDVGVRNAAEGGRVVKATAAGDMLQRLIGPAGVVMIAGVIMCSTFGAINTNLLTAPRITFAMGRDGVFFRDLGRVHATFRTPAAAIFVTAAMAIGLVVLASVAKALVFDVDTSAYTWNLGREFVESLKTGTIFDLATNCVIFSASVFYALAVLALIVLRMRRPDLPRSYHTPGYPVVPLVFIAVYGWFLWEILRGKPLESGFGMLMISLGVPAFFAYRRWSRGHDSDAL
ncbi:MAG: amino acid permease [Pirellulaceae bacterium]